MAPGLVPGPRRRLGAQAPLVGWKTAPEQASRMLLNCWKPQKAWRTAVPEKSPR
ncbi:hypothetical protein CLOLEP_02527 [[Clostridium] leptum DSM 753]|uniref:Uncharacterized protein n=1 Tax=[Clostridium] leptum DSM 753 TaxID=428125 RepID=A7VVB5_9FIRM|nr:hypothetical protein CLOLEP_02527 [[Clostridium] leptum DSM 753]